MRILIYVICLLAVPLLAYSQNSAITQYDEYRRQAHKDYADFRRRCNAEYAEFLRQVWQSYEAGPVLTMPQEPLVPPVVMPEEDRDKAVVPRQLPIDSIVAPVQREPQPKPVAPIYEQPLSEERKVSFTFFGTPCQVRMPDKVSLLSVLNGNISEDRVADAWTMLSDGAYDNTVRDCLEMRLRFDLCDWAFLLMLRELCEASCGGRTNAAVMLTGWLYCQCGYQMRFGIAPRGLYLLFGSRHQIFNSGCFTFEGNNFYPLLHDGEDFDGKVQISGPSFPEEKPLSLYINQALRLADNASAQRSIRAKRYPQAAFTVSVNRNLVDFYNTYPTSVLGDNFCTRWAMYANTPMAENVRNSLYTQIRGAVSGLSQLDAANLLLNWVQTGFVYEYDDKVWGHDRAFFAEETLMYPYCDCEDRSILFTRLIRDILGLRCILIYYPGHLAAAVCFTEPVKGDYIMLNGMRFTVADPTYIGAPVGCTMPDMDNRTATVILLQQ